jgi:hypothetical protein
MLSKVVSSVSEEEVSPSIETEKPASVKNWAVASLSI